MVKLALLVLFVPVLVAVQAEEQAPESSSTTPSKNQFDEDNVKDQDDLKRIGADPAEISPDETIRINALAHSNVPIHGIPKHMPAPILIRQFKPNTVAPPNTNDIEVTAPTPAFPSSAYSPRLYYNRDVLKPIQYSQSITYPQVRYTEPKDTPKQTHASSIPDYQLLPFPRRPVSFIASASTEQPSSSLESFNYLKTISQTERPIYRPTPSFPRPISQPSPTVTPRVEASSLAPLSEPKYFLEQAATFEPISGQTYAQTNEPATGSPIELSPIYRYPPYRVTLRPVPRPVVTYPLEHSYSVEIIPNSTPTPVSEQPYEPLKVTSPEPSLPELAPETVPKPSSESLAVPLTEPTLPKPFSSPEPLPIPAPETSSVPIPHPESSTETFPQPIPGRTLIVPGPSPELVPEPEQYPLPNPYPQSEAYPIPESSSLSETGPRNRPTTPQPVTFPAQTTVSPISPATRYLPPRHQHGSRPFRPVYNPVPHYTTPLPIPTTPPPRVTFPTHVPKFIPDAASTLEPITLPIPQPVTYHASPYVPRVPRPTPRPEPTKTLEPFPVSLHEPVHFPDHQPIPPQVPQPIPPQVPQPIPVPIPLPVSPLNALHPPAHAPEHYSSSNPNVSYFDNHCTEKNVYYRVENDCDAYIECKNYKPAEYLCPDGLHFNPNAVWPDYPCAYPSDVHCVGKTSSRPAEPTAQCPHKFGFFGIEGDCGRYIICQEGIATVMDCPAGLVFNLETSSCDWPEKVPSCKLEAFLGFTCPEPPLDEYGNPSDIVYNYRYGDSCTNYIACHRGHPRLLSCGYGYVFDDVSARCVSSDYPTKCSTL